jgi:hypothetical protein
VDNPVSIVPRDLDIPKIKIRLGYLICKGLFYSSLFQSLELKFEKLTSKFQFPFQEFECQKEGSGGKLFRVFHFRPINRSNQDRRFWIAF